MALALAVLAATAAAIPAGQRPLRTTLDYALARPGSGVSAVSTDYLADLFTSVERETPTGTELRVDGVIPPYVNGVLMRNGFGKYEGCDETESCDKSSKPDEPWQFKFVFDVMAQIVKFEIRNGRVFFGNTLLKSKFFNESKYEIPSYRTFGGYDPCRNAFGHATTIASLLSDNLNVNVVKFGKHVVAISDMVGTMEINEDTLDVIGQYPWNDDMLHPRPALFDILTCAHPSQLAGDTQVFSYVSSLLTNSRVDVSKPHKYKIYKFDPVNDPEPYAREILIEIPREEIPYVHSFAHTPNYVVFFEFPLFWNIPEIIANTEIYPSMTWKPEKLTHVIVVDVNTREIVMETDTHAFFAYHHVNAYEDEQGQLVMDICTYEDNKHLDSFNLGTLRNSSFSIPTGRLERFEINVAQRTISNRELANVSMDLPHVAPSKRGYSYRYTYGVADYQHGDTWWNMLVKVDVVTGQVWEWYVPGHWPSEPSFVADPAGTAEDDGVVLSLILGGDIQTSYLLVLDAKTWVPVATATANLKIPFTSHGYFETQA